MKLPALIFDFGNVVAHFDYRRAADRLARGRGLSGEELLERARPLGLGALARDFECGRLAAEEFSAGFCRAVGLEVGHDEFAAAWADIFALNEPVAALVAQLRRDGYTLVLGSNTNVLHAAHFRREFAATLAHFDRLVLSYEVGHMKPAPEFYRACVAAAGAPAGACVFVDDLPENVAGARAAGLAGVLYRDPAGLAAELAARLGRPTLSAAGV